MKYDLADRTLAITGAAGGLGADLAKAMRARGARIALLDLNRDAVCELADRLDGVAGAGIGSAIGPITALRRPVRPHSSKYVIRSGFA
jgi:NAD(P)-dependent dehydrogenase (short-subunit alcohol dehydrogenase family)